MAVSSIGGIADNSKLFEFSKDLVNKLKMKYNVILAGRSIMKMYPETDYHIFITASLEERVKRKSNQYKGEIPIEELTEQIKNRDTLQEKAGFYEISPNTIEIDVTECKTIKESTEKVLALIK